MKELKLSIILPCYNVQNYISESLDYLYSQDIPESDYEVICVNDCSPDDTRDIILKYQVKHSNLILIDHAENKRQGGARNSGLKVAKGNYIWFVDPDDYIKKNVLSELLKVCSDNSLDSLIFNFEKVDITGKSIGIDKFVTNSPVLTGINFLKSSFGDNFLNSYNGSIWNRIYRKDFLIKNKIYFQENMFWEDFEHSLKTIIFAERIMSLDKVFYNYRLNPQSVMSTLNSNKNMTALFDSTIKLGSMLIDFSEVLRLLDQKIAKTLKNGAIWRLNRFLKPLIKTETKNIKEFFVLIKTNQYLMKNYYNYFNTSNKFIVKYIRISKPIIILISAITKITAKFNN